MATLAQLEEAWAALHRLRIGKQVVKLQREGRMVEYSPANAAALEQYVKQLEQELGIGSMRRPIGVRA